MNKEHLIYFRVENFKCFDSLELTDIGQFNLIVGDNNVGKTSLLEAVSVLNDLYKRKQPHSELSSNLFYVLNRRGININNDPELFFKYVSKNGSKPVEIQYSYDNRQRTKIAFKKKESSIEVLFTENSVSDQPDVATDNRFPIGPGNPNPSLVPANLEINNSLFVDYQRILGYSIANKRALIDNLKVIDKRIIDIDVIPIAGTQHVMVAFDDNDLYMPITGMGESAVRVFYYLLHIIQSKGKRLMIDEIDTGIHYTRMKGFLKNIIQIAQKNDVQLFITTHSLECQQAFVEVFEDADMMEHQANVRQYTLIQNEKNQVVASVRSFDQLESSLEVGFDTRGGN